MAKYIDADRLKAEIERLKIKACGSQAKEEEIAAALSSLDLVIRFIDSLQQEQSELPKIAEYYYHKGVYEGLSQGRADALKTLEEFMKRKADPVIVIKQQEQPEAELSEETLREGFRAIDHRCFDEGIVGWEREKLIARYFHELGLKARKEV